MTAAPPLGTRPALPAVLSPLGAGAAKDTRLPKGVTLAPGAADGLFVLHAASTTLPEAVAELPPQVPFARLFLHPEAAREEGMLARLRPRRQISVAIRASALLARGYKSIEAAEIDGLDWVWASAPDGTP